MLNAISSYPNSLREVMLGIILLKTWAQRDSAKKTSKFGLDTVRSWAQGYYSFRSTKAEVSV
jgi:hypothetical protein